MNLEQTHRIDITLTDGARRSVMGTRITDEDQHCVVVTDGDRVVAWFDWATVRAWSEAGSEEAPLAASAAA